MVNENKFINGSEPVEKVMSCQGLISMIAAEDQQRLHCSVISSVLSGHPHSGHVLKYLVL